MNKDYIEIEEEKNESQDDVSDFGPLASDSTEHPDLVGGEHTRGLQDRPQDWRIICPPKNWKEPLPVDLGELRLLEILSQRLNLVVTRDDKRRKLYLGNALVSTDEGEAEVDSPPINGLRFGSGWIAEIISDDKAGTEYEAIDPATAAPLISAFPDHQISKNFRLSEFRPGEHSYDLIRLSPALVNTLEDIRNRAGGQPLHITSGYRPIAYNRKEGGVSNSPHIDGLAADIYSDHMSTEGLYDICDRVIGDRGGVGYYPSDGFIHVDLRGYKARW
jgi:Peptidase M15